MNIQLIKESKKWWESFDYYDQISNNCDFSYFEETCNP